MKLITLAMAEVTEFTVHNVRQHSESFLQAHLLNEVVKELQYTVT